MDINCVYCRIGSGHDADTRYVPLRTYANLMAFYNPDTRWPVHVTVVPREHTRFADVITGLLLWELLQGARDVISYVERTHPEYKFVQEIARVGTKQDAHLSLHIIATNEPIW